MIVASSEGSTGGGFAPKLTHMDLNSLAAHLLLAGCRPEASLSAGLHGPLQEAAHGSFFITASVLWVPKAIHHSQMS